MTLPAQLDVSANGAAIYSIPITVPPGTAGMVPALSLDYSSQSGNGIMGLGWSLGGLPSIGRCPRTQAQDGVRGAIGYDLNDRFCIEGERLVVINGTYGADGSEYRTETEGFSKIVAYGQAGNGPAYFKVWTKTGQIMEFGNTADSRIEAQGKTTARVWAANKISDTKGNYLTVTYTEDATTGQAYPTRIDYTGNASAGLSPYNSVVFEYDENRPDPITLYHAGSLLKTTALLTNVKTFKGANLVSDYQISYQLGDGVTPSKITSIRLCAAGGACLPATTFTWETTSTVSFTPKAVALTNWCTGEQVGYGDFNGDGKTDLHCHKASNGRQYIALSSGNGNFTAAPLGLTNWCTNTQIDYGDFNGDGKTDLVCFNSAGGVRIALSNGDGTFATPPQSFSNWCQTDTPPDTVRILGDFNGDGRTDLSCYYGAIAILHLPSYERLAFSNGDGTFATPPPTLFDWCPISSYVVLRSGDFNGDGKTDLFCHIATSAYSADLLFALSNDDGTFTTPPPALPPAIFSSGVAWRFGDFNGDGKTDLHLRQLPMYPNFFFFSKGDGSLEGFVEGVFSPPASCSVHFGYVDFNGDGKTDLHCHYALNNGQGVMVPTGDHTIYLSNGDATFTGPAQALSNWCADQYVGYGDFNGDGKTDLHCHETDYNGVQYVPNGTQYVALNDDPHVLLKAITSGLGTETAITYKPLTDSSVYTKDTDAVYPTVDAQGPMYVVSRIDAPDGIGGTYSSTYRYAGAKADFDGRGFLGFRKWIITDLQTDVVQTTNYHQDYPYTELIASETKTLNSLTLNSTTNTFDATNLGGTRRFVFVTQSVKASTDLDGTALPTVTTTYQYDSFGNPTQIAVSTPDGATKTTTNTYTNDTANWFLGRLTQASATSTVPDPPPPPSPPPPNNPPSAIDDSISTLAGTAKTFDPRTNDSDLDDDPLTITGKTNGDHGTVTINGGSSLTYTPEAGYVGTDSFTYTIFDGRGGTDTASVSVTIAANQPPVAVNDSISTSVGAAKTFDPRTNDTDPEGDPLTITDKTDGAHGTVAINGGTSLTFTPEAGYSGADSFTYTISDGHGNTATGNVSVTVIANQSPVAVNDSISTPGGVAKTFDPRTNDSDPDSDPLTITAKTNGAQGTVAILSGGTQLSYTPSSGYIGTDSFTYTISDGQGGTDTATVNVTLTNSPPDAVNDSKTVNQESGANTINVRANDTDPNGHTLTITSKTNGSKGTVAITDGGTQVTYTPNNRVWGSDSFTYTVSDGNGGTDTATVNVTINQVDELVMNGQATYTQYYYGYWQDNYYVYLYYVIDTRTSSMVYVSSQLPPCNSTSGWVSGFWAPSSGCKVYKDLTP